MRQSVVLNEVLAALSGEPVIALVVAAALTALSTSSLAVILLVISLVTHGIVDLPLGFALVLGANLGGGITPLLGTLGAEPEARRSEERRVGKGVSVRVDLGGRRVIKKKKIKNKKQ